MQEPATQSITTPVAQVSAVEDESSTESDVVPVLADGVYPVAMGQEINQEGLKVFELSVLAVEGSDDDPSDTKKIVDNLLVKFDQNPEFDFKFEEGECTMIGFKNSEKLKNYTGENVGGKLAIVVGNQVVSQHKIRESIQSDFVQVTCCTEGGGDHLFRHLTELKKQ